MPDCGRAGLVAAGTVSARRTPLRSSSISDDEPSAIETAEASASPAACVASSDGAGVGTEFPVTFGGGIGPTGCVVPGAGFAGMSLGWAEEKSLFSGTLKFAGMTSVLFVSG